jgi:DNA-binding IscR family transcriptional regulator
MEIGCAMLDTWREVRDATIKILERTTFADLAKRAGGPWIQRDIPVRSGKTAVSAGRRNPATTA